MKQLLFVIVLMLSTIAVNAQKKVALDSLGNYVSITTGVTPNKDKETGKFFIDTKGVKYPVRCSINNKLYYLKTAKSGNVYKVYLKTK